MSQRLPMEESEKINVYRAPDWSPTSNDDFITNTDSPKIWQIFMKNWPIISQKVVLLIAAILTWGIVYSIFPQHTHVNAPIMRLAFLFIGAEIVGVFVGLTGLPDILGMLFWGVLYKNIGLANFEGLSGLEAFLREMALVSIMLLAGLGLDLEALKKLCGMVTRLTLVPTFVEVVCVAVLSFFLLKMPWLWGILLGYVCISIIYQTFNNII